MEVFLHFRDSDRLVGLARCSLLNSQSHRGFSPVEELSTLVPQPL